MISKEKLQAEPLFVSLRGQMIEDDSWITFDHYHLDKGQLFLLGFNLEHEEKRVLFEHVKFTDGNLEYSIAFLESKLNGMSQALHTLKKIKTEKGQ